MRSLATGSPARSAQEPAMSEGMTKLLPHVESHGFFNFVETEECCTPSMRGCGWVPLTGRIGSVDSVHTLGHGLGHTGARTGPDCGGFRGSGEYSGAGTRFESHLGHSV